MKKQDIGMYAEMCRVCVCVCVSRVICSDAVLTNEAE